MATSLVIYSSYISHDLHVHTGSYILYFNARPTSVFQIAHISYIIESVDSISRDELDVPLTQYITNA